MSNWKYLDITKCPKCKGDVEVNEKSQVRCVNCKNMKGIYHINSATYTGYVQWVLNKKNF